MVYSGMERFKSNKKRIERLIGLFVFLFFITTILICCPLYHFKYSYRMEYIEPTYSIRYTPITDKNLVNLNVLDEVNNLFNYSNYSLIYYDFRSENKGQQVITKADTNILTRTIRIQSDLDIFFFTFSLTHELVHLTYYTASERFCNYKSFELLYENEKLKDVAYWYINMELCDNIPNEYKCLGYIENYLKGE